MRVLICDTCGAVIPLGVPYRVGYATPEAIAEWFGDKPDVVPGFTVQADSIVRFDLCVGCAPEGSGPAAVMVETVDRLQ